MKTQESVFTFAWILALLVATPAVAQLRNHPFQASAAAAGVTFFVAQFARGLNEDSGKQSSFAAGVGRAMERVSFLAMGGYVASDTEELQLGAKVAVHLLIDDGTPVQVSVQSGLGWISEDVGTESRSTLNFPVGVAIQARLSDSGISVRSWMMPRLHIIRTGELGVIPGNTETDFGASGGVSFTGESGVGAHLAIDWVHTDFADPFRFAIGMHYVV